MEDIKDLNGRVVEKLKNYNDAGFSITVTVSFVGRQTIEFSTWTEFECHNWNESNAVDSITCIWEFNALLPQYKVPQKHVLVVKLTDGLRPEEMLNIVFAGKLENIEDIQKQMFPVVARVDFINYVLGDELLHIVEEWNNGLELQEEESTILNLKKHRRKIAFTLNYITEGVVLLLFIKMSLNVLYGFKINSLLELNMDNVCKLVWMIGFMIMIYKLIDGFSVWLAEIFYRTWGTAQEGHVFDINKGDAQIHKKLLKEHKKNKWLSFSSIVGTFLINLFCAIICSIIV